MNNTYQYAIRWNQDENDGCHWFGEKENSLELNYAPCSVSKNKRKLFDEKKLAHLVCAVLNFGIKNKKLNGYKVVRVPVEKFYNHIGSD